MPIGNLMTPPRCSARAAATVIRRRRTAVVDGGTPQSMGARRQAPLIRTSHSVGLLLGRTGQIFSLIFPTAGRRSLVISANAYIDHYATIYIDHYATIRHRQDQVPRTLLLHMC